MSEVDAEVKLAKEAFDDLDVVKKASLRRRYTTLYFSVYHAAKAALLALEYSPKSHSGLDSLIHSILVKDKGLLSQEKATLFSKLRSRREQADYEVGFYGSNEEFKELLGPGEKLMKRLVEIAETNSD